MLELDLKIIDVIKNDSTMISLMGITAEDSRIYSWEPQIEIDYIQGTKDVSLIYKDSMGGRSSLWSYPSQFPNIIYFFRVLSIDQLKRRQCSERLIDLFDKTSMQSTNWNVKWIELLGASDGINEGSPTNPIFTRNVNFTFKIVVKRGSV